MSKKIKVGILGCGNISSQYLKQVPYFAKQDYFSHLGEDWLTMSSCCDLDATKRKEVAEAHNLKAYDSLTTFFAEDDCDIVLNLTPPQFHLEVIEQALKHGKNVYTEKPLGNDFDEAQRLVNLARSLKLNIGCAPDMFLGAPLQQARKLIDAGKIGRIHGGLATMLGRGPEAWHPNPHFFYAKGAGPLFDMGPYYISTLLYLLGPVKSIMAQNHKMLEQREVGSGTLKGEKIAVDVPTHYQICLNFVSGASVTLIMSFDVVSANFNSKIELYGEEGTLLMGDPNNADEPNKISSLAEPEAREEAVQSSLPDGFRVRGLGLCQMAQGIVENKEIIVNAELALHSLEIMFGCEKAAEENQLYYCQTSCSRPSLLEDVLS